MKKLLTVLLTLLMVFTLVGCNSKEQPPVVDEPQQEVVEPKDDEPIVGGFVDAEDGTLTDELKDIFNKALEGLLGATYEPQELVATQVVAGTNYKFLANGTKTTNPITKGTYYITIYKDLQGNIELKDIEVIEEKQEEAPKQDVTQMSFWVVFYDQYGNELQRQALKYGTVPEYKSWLPEGFDKWVYKNTGKDVETLKAITGNTYYQAVCHEVHHSSSDPTPEPTPGPTPTPIVSVTSVSLNETALTLSVDNTGTLAATVLPENATNKNVTWSSDNESVATVSNGTVTAIANGSATITVTTEDGNYTDTCTVTVAPKYTVTFDLYGITGTAPDSQTIANGGLVTEPDIPTYANHTFAGWYKTKNTTTGLLSDPWNFNTDVVTNDMTLYAKWTKLMRDLLGNGFPKSTTNAWTNGNGNKAYISPDNNNYFRLDADNDKRLTCYLTNPFTRINDGKYVFEFVDSGNYKGVYTLNIENIENGELDSIEYDGADTDYAALSGTYAAPTAN